MNNCWPKAMSRAASGSGTFISSDLTGLASRRRSAPRAIKRVVRHRRRLFDFERSAMQSDARPFNTGRTLIDARTAGRGGPDASRRAPAWSERPRLHGSRRARRAPREHL